MNILKFEEQKVEKDKFIPTHLKAGGERNKSFWQYRNHCMKNLSDRRSCGGGDGGNNDFKDNISRTEFLFKLEPAQTISL